MKHSIPPIKKILIISLVMLIGILGVVLINENNKTGEHHDYSLENLNVKEVRQKIKDQIDQIGAKKTYLELTNRYGNNYTFGHNVLHIFGEELYEELGESGIVVCDGQLGFGCFHGFATQVMVTNGAGKIVDLESICNKSYPEGAMACIHGLGHGALEFAGHNNVNKAIEICSTLNDKSILFGCNDGVFMEYFSLAEFENLHVPQNKIFTSASCSKVKGKYKLSCYKNLGHYWVQSRKFPLSEVGIKCGKITDSEGRQSCYYGVGNILPVMGNYDPNVSTSRLAGECDNMPDYDANSICRTAIFALLARGEHARSDARLACSDLPEASKQKCLNMNIIAHLENYENP